MVDRAGGRRRAAGAPGSGGSPSPGRPWPGPQAARASGPGAGPGLRATVASYSVALALSRWLRGSGCDDLDTADSDVSVHFPSRSGRPGPVTPGHSVTRDRTAGPGPGRVSCPLAGPRDWARLSLAVPCRRHGALPGPALARLSGCQWPGPSGLPGQCRPGPGAPGHGRRGGLALALSRWLRRPQVDSADSDVSIHIPSRSGRPAGGHGHSLTGIRVMPRATGPGCPGPSVR